MLQRTVVHRNAATILISMLLVLSMTGAAPAADATGTRSITDTAACSVTAGIAETASPAQAAAALAPPIMPGWPQTMGVSSFLFLPVGVVLADVDNDGDQEVLAGSTDGLFRVWHHDGTLLPGWPYAVGGQVQSKAAAADLDQNGDLEILVSVKSGQLHVIHHDGTPVAGWPQPTGLTFGFLSPVVYDLDGDTTPEVLIGGGGLVRAWHADGTPVDGFPVAVAGTISATLAVGDVIGNSEPEIFAVTTSPGNLHALHADGTVPTGWPQALGLSTSYAAPSIGDIDFDGAREVQVVAYNFNVSSSIFSFRGDGSLMPGFPVTYGSAQTYSCPVIGDVDGDDDLELFNAGKLDNPNFYALDHTGAQLPGWPTVGGANMEGSAVIADFDGDAELEIVIADNGSPPTFQGYNPDGTIAAEFPFQGNGTCYPNAPELADVDNDGDLDMAMTQSTAADGGIVAIWDFSAPYDPDAVEWGGLFHDNWNTNQHGFVIPTGGTGVAMASAPARVVHLDPVAPNPFNPSTRISFELARSGRATIQVHDAQGRLVRLLLDETLGAGAHSVRWDGRDAGGVRQASGIYWVRLRAAGDEQTTGVALIQ